MAIVVIDELELWITINVENVGEAGHLLLIIDVVIISWLALIKGKCVRLIH